MVADLRTGDAKWTVSEKMDAARGWAIIEALSPETVYEMRVVARSAAGTAESASFIQRVRIGLKRGMSRIFVALYYAPALPMANFLAAPVTSIINSSLLQGIVPDQWKISRI